MVRTKPTRLKDSDASVGRSSEFWCRLQPVRFSIILQPAINFFWRFHSISHTASLLDRLFALILEEAAPHLFLTSIHTLVEFYTATERKHVFNTPCERTSLHRRPTGRKSIRTHPQIRLSAIQLQTNRHEPTRLAQKPARGHGIPSQTHRGQKPVQSHIMAPCRTALHPLYVPPPKTPTQHSYPRTTNTHPTGQLIWTAHSLGHAPSLTTSTRATEAEQKIAAASAPVKKSMDDLGVWQKPRKGHAPLAVLFDHTTKADERFVFAEGAISGHMGACWGGLVELNKRIERARGRHVGLRLLAGKAT